MRCDIQDGCTRRSRLSSIRSARALATRFRNWYPNDGWRDQLVHSSPGEPHKRAGALTTDGRVVPIRRPESRPSKQTPGDVGLTNHQIIDALEAQEELDAPGQQDENGAGLVVLTQDQGAGLEGPLLRGCGQLLEGPTGQPFKERERLEVEHRSTFISLYPVSVSHDHRAPGPTRDLCMPQAPIRPEDFLRFWASTIRALDACDPGLEIQAIEQATDGRLALERVSFTSLGNVRLAAYALGWRDARPRPLVVHSHGYGSMCTPMWSWAAAGLNVVGVDIRGFGVSHSAVPMPSRHGYVLTGIEAPETYVLRGAVCDYVQAARMARTIYRGRIERLIFEGTSFAGGLALMAEATAPAADLLVVGVPTFGWAEGRQFFVKGGSGAEINQFLQARPDRAEDLAVVLRYFDAANFAGLVQCPVLIGVGRRDDVVPAPTVRAIANQLTGPHEVMEFPVSHTDSPEEQHWQEFERYWISLALTGVPPEFGARAAE